MLFRDPRFMETSISHMAVADINCLKEIQIPNKFSDVFLQSSICLRLGFTVLGIELSLAKDRTSFSPPTTLGTYLFFPFQTITLGGHLLSATRTHFLPSSPHLPCMPCYWLRAQQHSYREIAKELNQTLQLSVTQQT